MCYTSPSKLLRSVRRLTKFIENKPDILSVTTLPPIDIFPAARLLKISQQINVDIFPEKKKLSIAMVSSTSIPPADAETNGYLIAQLRNMKFVLEEIDLINDLVDYRQEQIQMLSKIIPQFEDVLPT